MKKKYRFRKVYFNCYDNKAMEEEYEMTNVFRRREYALSIAKGQRERENNKYLWEKDKPIRKVSTEGFYLVHESLFDELLREHARD